MLSYDTMQSWAFKSLFITLYL